MLDLFTEFEISATWATVGALLMAQPGGTKRHRMLSPSRYRDIPPGDHLTAPDWYAEDVLQWILDCPVTQELGCHTLTHLYVDSRTEGREEFADELDLFLELFEELQLPRPRSFVFPKAYQAHFSLLAERGFCSYRGPENRWFERLPGTLPAASFRWLDCALALSPQVDRSVLTPAGLWEIPASQFYSPFMGVGSKVPMKSRVRKAEKGLDIAAQRGGVFHLWTHPFNMGCNTGELMDGLRKILQRVGQLREQNRLQTMSMGGLTERLNCSTRERTQND